MGVGHVPQDPVHPPGEGADVQGRQRGGTAAAGALTPAQARGRFGEDLAARWYVRHGYEIVARNWRCPTGELDVVARRGDVLVFCEVKARATAGFDGPAAAVDHRKQRRVRAVAAAWLTAHRPGAVEIRFDVAAVTGGRIVVIEAAF
ncbi:MAG: YraN family protein [Acidimicrobiaceae bacterium]|nr:YraN family protein [Acidimicrobiaceae bacterium]